MVYLANHADFKSLVRHEGAEGHFAYVDPPFNFNHPEVAKYPPEVTGYFLLNSLCRRIGWSSLNGRRLLDFGCGVRFPRTIVNLAINIDLYAGIDANREAISWLQSEIRDPRFRFEHLDMHNLMYQATGSPSVDAGALQRLGLADFDAACMFSVITHQLPKDSGLIFSMLYRCVKPGGGLYFTAIIDETVHDYVERDPSQPCLRSAYHPDFLIDLVSKVWLERGENLSPIATSNGRFCLSEASDRLSSQTRPLLGIQTDPLPRIPRIDLLCRLPL